MNDVRKRVSRGEREVEDLLKSRCGEKQGTFIPSSGWNVIARCRKELPQSRRRNVSWLARSGDHTVRCLGQL